MNNLAIIPARGGSKRIERKNIKDFNGKPVMAYAIQAALRSGLFKEVMVSTDDKEIAAVALANQASVPFMRSSKNADDHATLADVLIEVLLAYRKTGREFDAVCCILPTAALISDERLNEAYQKFSSQNFSSVIPVLRFAYPVQRALKDAGGLLQMREPAHLNSRSQDLETFYHDSGQFYWARTGDLLKEKTLFTANTGYIELEETEAQDVDTMQDWDMLNIKYTYLKNLKVKS